MERKLAFIVLLMLIVLGHSQN